MGAGGNGGMVVVGGGNGWVDGWKGDSTHPPTHPGGGWRYGGWVGGGVVLIKFPGGLGFVEPVGPGLFFFVFLLMLFQPFS